uniref:Immunoglobulin V-set domain-containing protein n=1 Tax=Neogobius melanostomus TaxID=47308 RepID=A0A8C6TBZ9_9GOBI
VICCHFAWVILSFYFSDSLHDLILPYETDPPCNVSKSFVEWRRNSDIVHARRKGKDEPVGQDRAFKGRTETFSDDMGNGKFSLKISNVMKKDEGIYTVNYTKTLSKCNVTVTIGKNVEHPKYLYPLSSFVFLVLTPQPYLIMSGLKSVSVQF